MKYFARGDGSNALELDIYDYVDTWGGVSARGVRNFLRANAKAQNIRVRINSDGGDVFEGFAIYDLLKEHQARVEVSVDGLAASIASVIAMAADDIEIASQGWMMIHNPWGGVRGGAEDMRRWADVLEKMGDQAAAIYAERTGQTKAKVLELMSAETWMDAAQAKDLGFVDRVRAMKKQQPKAAARAFAMMRIDDFANVPSALRDAVINSRGVFAWAPSIDIGDRVQVRSGMEHEPDLKDAIGTVRVINTSALGIEFDKMPGEIHRWFVEDELEHLESSDTDDKPPMSATDQRSASWPLWR